MGVGAPICRRIFVFQLGYSNIFHRFQVILQKKQKENQRFCAAQAFCAAKPGRRTDSLRQNILISRRSPASPPIQCASGAGGGSEFLPADEKAGHPVWMSCFNMERATRLARGAIAPRHAQWASNAPPGRFFASLAPCSTLCPLKPKSKGMTGVMPLLFGAGDEARTRYLHLGKVALYQMSYARGTKRILPDDPLFVKMKF